MEILGWRDKGTLSVGMKAPTGPSGRLDDATLRSLIDIMERRPLRAEWLDSLPDAFLA